MSKDNNKYPTAQKLGPSSSAAGHSSTSSSSSSSPAPEPPSPAPSHILPLHGTTTMSSPSTTPTTPASDSGSEFPVHQVDSSSATAHRTFTGRRPAPLATQSESEGVDTPLSPFMSPESALSPITPNMNLAPFLASDHLPPPPSSSSLPISPTGAIRSASFTVEPGSPLSTISNSTQVNSELHHTSSRSENSLSNSSGTAWPTSDDSLSNISDIVSPLEEKLQQNGVTDADLPKTIVKAINEAQPASAMTHSDTVTDKAAGPSPEAIIAAKRHATIEAFKVLAEREQADKSPGAKQKWEKIRQDVFIEYLKQPEIKGHWSWSKTGTTFLDTTKNVGVLVAGIAITPIFAEFFRSLLKTGARAALPYVPSAKVVLGVAVNPWLTTAITVGFMAYGAIRFAKAIHNTIKLKRSEKQIKEFDEFVTQCLRDLPQNDPLLPEIAQACAVAGRSISGLDKSQALNLVKKRALDDRPNDSAALKKQIEEALSPQSLNASTSKLMQLGKVGMNKGLGFNLG